MRVSPLIISVCVSAVLGLAALFVAKTLLPAQAAAKVPGLGAPQPTAGVAVVVAAKDLKYGDKIDASDLRVTRLPPEDVPQGAFTTPAAVLAADHGGPPVVLTPIAAREPVLPTKLSGPGARPSVAAEIADGMRAFTIHVTDVTGVGGHALPGDHVDVVLTRDLNPGGPIHAFVSQMVLQNVRVLAVDLNADLTSDKPSTPSTATLEVPVEDAGKLASAANVGQLSLALRRTGATEIAGGAKGQPPLIGNPALHTVARRYVEGPRTGGGIEIIYGAHRGSREPAPAPVAPAAAPAAVQPVAAAATFG